MFMIFHNKQQIYERYDLTWRNDTLFLSKWTSDPYLNSSLGHGTGFEQATCIYDDQEDDLLKSSASHHRVMEYRFGGLQFVVQSEIDAYHCDCHRPSNFDPTLPETLSALTVDEVSQHQRRSSAVSAGSSQTSTNLSVFSSPFDACRRDSHITGEIPPSSPPPSPCRPLSMDKTPGPCVPGHLITSSFASSATLRVLHLGRDIPPHCLVEVKTHKVRNKPLFNAEAQLYFSQIHKLYIAKNDNGRFFPSGNGYNNSVVEEDKMEDIQLWADTEQNQRTLKKVVALLKKIRELARQMEKEKGVRTTTLLMKCDGMGTSESGREGETGRVKITLYERRDSMEEEGTGGCLPRAYLDSLGGDGNGLGGKEGKEGKEGMGGGGGLEDGLEDGVSEDGTLYDWGVGGLGFPR